MNQQKFFTANNKQCMVPHIALPLGQYLDIAVKGGFQLSHLIYRFVVIKISNFILVTCTCGVEFYVLTITQNVIIPFCG